MKMSTICVGKANGSEPKAKTRRLILSVLLLSVLFSAGGCEGYYSAYPGYGPNYGPGPYYGGYPGGVAVTVYDRPYYVRGPGYWSGRTYYVWKPGHWAWRHGQKVWIHGHYVVRGY
jgi:WXXGXW repeat (2 copies)